MPHPSVLEECGFTRSTSTPLERLRHKIDAAQRHTFRESRYSAIQPEKRQCRFEGRPISREFPSCSRPLACTEQSECALRARQRQDRRDRARSAPAPSTRSTKWAAPPHARHHYRALCAIANESGYIFPRIARISIRCDYLFLNRGRSAGTLGWDFASVPGSATLIVPSAGWESRWPRNAIAPTGKQGEAMRPSSIYNRWTQFIETRRKKWASWGNGIIQALAEEEMKIRREELLKEVTAHSQRD